jgi:hypothetical protein
LFLSGSCFAIRYPFPEIRGEVPKNFEWIDFFDRGLSVFKGLRLRARLRQDETARQARINAKTFARILTRSVRTKEKAATR